MQFSVRHGSSGWASLARLTSRAFVLAALAGVAVFLFSGTASAAETCKSECEDASDNAARNLLGSSLNAVDGLVQQPVRQLLGRGHGAAPTTSSDSAAPVPSKATAPATAPEDTSPGLTPQAPNAASTAATLDAATSSLAVAEPVASTVTDTAEAVEPVANTMAITPAGDLLQGQSLRDAVDTTTDAIAQLGAAAVPAVVATVQTLDASTQQLVGTAQVTTTALLDSAQQVVTTVTSSLQPVTDSLTGALATALGGPAPAGSAPSAAQAEPGSGVTHPGAATLGDSLPVTGVPFSDLWSDLVVQAASADGQVPTPPPEQTSASDGDENALVLTGHQAAVVPAASGAGAVNGGTTSPSAPELGKLFFGLAPAAPQPGFVPALHHSVHVPSAPVVEPAQSPD